MPDFEGSERGETGRTRVSNGMRRMRRARRVFWDRNELFWMSVGGANWKTRFQVGTRLTGDLREGKNRGKLRYGINDEY